MHGNSICLVYPQIIMYQLRGFQDEQKINGWQTDDDQSPYSHNLLKVLEHNIATSERQQARAALVYDHNTTNLPIHSSRPKTGKLQERLPSHDFVSINSQRLPPKIYDACQLHRYIRSHSSNANHKQNTSKMLSHQISLKAANPTYLSKIHNQRTLQSCIPSACKQKTEELPIKKQSLTFGHHKYNSSNPTVLNFHEMEIKMRRNKMKNSGSSGVGLKKQDKIEIVIETKNQRAINNENILSQRHINKIKQKVLSRQENLQPSNATLDLKLPHSQRNGRSQYTKLSTRNRQQQMSTRMLTNIRINETRRIPASSVTTQAKDSFTDVHLNEQYSIDANKIIHS